jgi:hypothetical protein
MTSKSENGTDNSITISVLLQVKLIANNVLNTVYLFFSSLGFNLRKPNQKQGTYFPLHHLANRCLNGTVVPE